MNQDIPARMKTEARDMTMKAIESGAIGIKVTCEKDAAEYAKAVATLYNSILDELKKGSFN